VSSAAEDTKVVDTFADSPAYIRAWIEQFAGHSGGQRKPGRPRADES
jgi:hypothetical protein